SDRNAECSPEEHDAWEAANHIDSAHARIAELEAQLAAKETENEHLRNDYGDLDARLHLVTLDRDRCAAKAEALSRTGAVKGALEKLAALAERQKAYHNAKQH